MIQLENFFSAVVFGVSVISPYRAFYGPQKKFAHTSSLLMAIGLFFLECTDQSGDFLSWIGGIFLNFALVIGIFMIGIEILWTVRTEFFFKKNNK